MPAVEAVMIMLPPPRARMRSDGILEPQPDAAYVHSHDLIEDVNGIVGNGLHDAFNTGVGEHNVNALVAFECGLDVTLHLGWLGDISHCVAGDRTAKRVHDALECRLVAVHQQYLWRPCR